MLSFLIMTILLMRLPMVWKNRIHWLTCFFSFSLVGMYLSLLT